MEISNSSYASAISMFSAFSKVDFGFDKLQRSLDSMTKVAANATLSMNSLTASALASSNIMFNLYPNVDVLKNVTSGLNPLIGNLNETFSSFQRACDLSIESSNKLAMNINSSKFFNNLIPSLSIPSSLLNITSSSLLGLSEYSKLSSSLISSIVQPMQSLTELVPIYGDTTQSLSATVKESQPTFEEILNNLISQRALDNSEITETSWNDTESTEFCINPDLYVATQTNAPPIYKQLELYMIKGWITYNEKVFPWVVKAILTHYGEKFLFAILGIS